MKQGFLKYLSEGDVVEVQRGSGVSHSGYVQSVNENGAIFKIIGLEGGHLFTLEDCQSGRVKLYRNGRELDFGQPQKVNLDSTMFEMPQDRPLGRDNARLVTLESIDSNQTATAPKPSTSEPIKRRRTDWGTDEEAVEYIKGKSVKELAADLDITPFAVRSKIKHLGEKGYIVEMKRERAPMKPKVAKENKAVEEIKWKFMGLGRDKSETIAEAIERSEWKPIEVPELNGVIYDAKLYPKALTPE